ncbi:MAG: hypothetical protein GY950_28985 [bacterium]|nr:hypothetical protein [bacterium]
MSNDIKDEEKQSKYVSGKCYETCFTRVRTAGTSIYFKPESPGSCGGYSWIATDISWPTYPILKEAFDNGKKVKVWVGYPHINKVDRSSCATVKNAETIWQV